MMSSDWQQIRELFDMAAGLPAKERIRFLEQACQGRQEIRAEVEKLLQADSISGQGDFLNQPIWEWNVMAQLDPSERTLHLPFTEEDQKKYRLLRMLGQGGMGTVYLVYSQERQDEVAIKVMEGEVSQEDLRRFEDERKILVRLDDHQHMVTFLGRGVLRNGRPYFVMKYVKGESLDAILKNGALPFEQIAKILEQLGRALLFAHQAGVIHRDIKPSNIMLSDIGGELCVKVLDFGIAILRESDDTTTKDFTKGVRCTPLYASPEQLLGKRRDEIDGRSDIFSLGVVVYEMLTGTKPFAPSVYSIRHPQTPEPPSQMRPDLNIPKALDKVLMTALATAPKDRYKDAKQFAAEFQAAIQPSVIRKEEKASLWQKYMLPAAALLLLTAGGGVGWQYWNSSGSPGVVNGNQPEEKITKNANSGDRNENRAPVLPPIANNNSTPEPPVRANLDISLIHHPDASSGKQAGAVPFDTVFTGADGGISWQVKPSQSGYLYIVCRGSSGKVAIFYPDIQVNSAQIQSGGMIRFPREEKKLLRFDDKPGIETYYFVFAAKKGEPGLVELEKAVMEKRAVLNDSQGQALINALQARTANDEPGPLVRVIPLQHR